MNAIAACGLQLYNFGQAVSLVFFTDNWRPDSFYDRIAENWKLGMHTLLLLDIKVKEQSEENLARRVGLCLSCHYLRYVRGRKIYERPRYMSIPLAVSQLIEVEALRKEGILTPASTLAISMSRVGGGPRQRIVAGTLEQLKQQDSSLYGEPLHSLVIVGKRLHPLEVEFASAFAIDGTWKRVARDVYRVADE